MLYICWQSLKEPDTNLFLLVWFKATCVFLLLLLGFTSNIFLNFKSVLVTILIFFRAYVTSKFYRELRLRAGVVYNKKLKILPLEQVISNTHGVWNLSSDQGSLGTFIVTNIRIVWFADINEGFNISLPYLQIQSVCDYRSIQIGRTKILNYFRFALETPSSARRWW